MSSINNRDANEKGVNSMSENNQYPVANLSEVELKEVKEFEKQLRNQTGEEIVLIAYNHKTE